MYLVKKIYYADGLELRNGEKIIQHIENYEQEYHEDIRKVINEKGLVRVTCDRCGDAVNKKFIFQPKRTVKCKTLNAQKHAIV